MIFSIGSVKNTPKIYLINWKVYEIENGSKHFVGYNRVIKFGQVSTNIVQFDKKEMLGVTRSGRIYKLEGGPGYNEDAAFVWKSWCLTNNVSFVSVKDVSEEYYMENVIGKE